MANDAHLEALFQRAAELRLAGEFAEAKPLFERLYEKAPTFAVCVLLADVLDELGSLERSCELFEEATLLQPRSEPTSVLLFHSLLGRGRREDAIAEMHRFVAERDPDEYLRIQRLIDDGQI
jgi:predicted Zn-dependent protease